MNEPKKRKDQVTIKIWPKTLVKLRELAEAYDEPMVRLLNRLVSKEVLERSAAAEQWAEMQESMASAKVDFSAPQEEWDAAMTRVKDELGIGDERND